MKSNLFFPWAYHLYLHNSFDVRLVFEEDADVTYGFKNNLEIIVIKKVKESYNPWQNIMRILKSIFKFPPLPLYNDANP